VFSCQIVVGGENARPSHSTAGIAPESELCAHSASHSSSSRYCLRSVNRNQLAVPPVKLSMYGGRRFSVSGPTAWNSLKPNSITLAGSKLAAVRSRFGAGSELVRRDSIMEFGR